MLDQATVTYIGEVLKYTAIPSGLFELLPPQRQREVERELHDFSRRSLKSLPILLVIAFLVAHTIHFVAPYILFLVLFERPLTLLGMMIAQRKSSLTIPLLVATFGLTATLVFAPLVWIFGHESFAALYAWFDIPLALVKRWIPLADWILPSFTAPGLAASYLATTTPWLEWLQGLWWIVQPIVWFTAKVSHGMFWLAVLGLYILLAIVLCLAVLLPLALIGRATFYFSDLLKQKLGLATESRLPLAAAFLFAAGETILFGVATQKYFWPP